MGVRVVHRIPYGRYPLKPTIIPKKEAKDGYYTHTRVIPETVGQFTGLFAMDDNDASAGGEMIFDGDIVDVVWSDEIGEPHSAYNCVVYLDDHTTMHLLEFSNRIRLVGNIHDNPELLEVSHA